MDEMMTVKEVASMLKMSTGKIYEMAERMGAVRIGTSIRFKRSSVIDIMANGIQENKQRYHLRKQSRPWKQPARA